MNRLAISKRTQVIAALVEGVSINATCRMTGVAKHTVLNLLRDLGCACAEYHNKTIRNLKVQRVQCDEIWAFCYSKDKNVPADKRGTFGFGDVWTWTGIDADSKLIISYLIGTRKASAALEFMKDLASRIANKFQLTTDGYRMYADAVEKCFGGDIDYAMLIKIFGTSGDSPEFRYSFTRLTNGFSKKIENHGHAVALYFMHYNFCRVHKSLRVTPAMEAGLTDHVWTLEELLHLIEGETP
jgi:IS1 family transposase